MSASKIPPRAYIEVDRFLRNLKVKVKVKDKDGNEPVRKIKQLERASAQDAKFKTEDGVMHTVEVRRLSKSSRTVGLSRLPASQSYFKTHYSVVLKRPDFVRTSWCFPLVKSSLTLDMFFQPCIRVSKVALWPLVTSSKPKTCL